MNPVQSATESAPAAPKASPRKRRRSLQTFRTAAWRSYFETNARSLRDIPWDSGAALSEAERAAAASSVPTFQIGETGSGRRLLAAAARYVDASGDVEYLPAIRLFIAEEQRHGADLGRWLDLEGIPRIEKHWTNHIFRRVRQLAGLELMISLLLTAEVMAKVYYAALRKATSSVALQRLCEQILKDEVAHIRFQTQQLALLRRRRPRAALMLLHAAQRALFAATTLVVWRTHRQVLRAGGLSFSKFRRNCRIEINIAMRLMLPSHYDFTCLPGEAGRLSDRNGPLEPEPA